MVIDAGSTPSGVKQAVAYIVSELRKDPEFDFYCLVDSVPLVNSLAQALRVAGIARPLQVFLEVGCEGGRTGCRTYEQCMDCTPRLTAGSELAHKSSSLCCVTY